MTQYTVDFSDEAWGAIRDQISYIAVEKKSPFNAAQWATRLYLAIETLEHLPRRFAIDRLQTLASGTDVHRMVFEQTYLAHYTVDDVELRVRVVSFRHGARKGIADDRTESTQE